MLRKRLRRHSFNCHAEVLRSIWSIGLDPSEYLRMTRVGAFVLFFIASWAVAELPAHPRLILPDADLPQVKRRIERFDWAKGAFEELKKRADEAAAQKIE